MSPRSLFVVMLMLSAFTYSSGQTVELETTEDPDITTEAPVTTPTPPASTVPPTVGPGDKAPRGSWNLTDNSRTCIQTMMGIRLEFQYMDAKNKTLNVTLDVPAEVNDTTVSGGCGNTNVADEKMDIAFFENWELSLIFRYGTDKNWAITDIAVTYNVTEDRFPNAVDLGVFTASLNNQTIFKTRNGSSYQCVNEFSMTGIESSPAGGPTLKITTTELRVEAFRMRTNPGDFSIPIPCPADTAVSNIVPIAVGAALAALVVIVLVAYLIGRKKSKRGYESV